MKDNKEEIDIIVVGFKKYRNGKVILLLNYVGNCLRWFLRIDLLGFWGGSESWYFMELL